MLNSVKDCHANMYESEILNYNDTEFRTLSFLRLRAGGENNVTWYSKESLRKELSIGRDKCDKVLNNLENTGAIIIFNAKDAKTKRVASNVYYISEYDPIKKEYITANSIQEIISYALEIREKKELEYAIKNNKKPRNFVLEERLTLEERKIKFYKKPTTENQYMEPTTENQYMEPTTDFQYHLNNKKVLNNKKKLNIKKENNNNKNDVVVNDDDIIVVKKYISKILTKIEDDEAFAITHDLKSIEKNIDVKTLDERLNAIKIYAAKHEIKNLIAIIRKAIQQQWKCPKSYSAKTGNFTDYDQRDYNFNELEKKLLGWDN